MEKYKKIVVIAAVAVTILYSFVFWIIPFEMTGCRVIVYVFSLAATFVGYYSAKTACETTFLLKSKIYGLPIIKIGLVYWLIQVLLSFLFSAIASFVKISLSIPIIVCLILLGASVIGVMTVDRFREGTKEYQRNQTVEISNMIYMRKKVNSMVAMCKDEGIKSGMVRLADDFKYSDPVSHQDLKKDEEWIRYLLDDTESILMQGKQNGILERIEEIRVLLVKRNEKCSYLKHSRSE